MAKHEIISGLSFADYKKNPGVNASFLKKYVVSPKYAVEDVFEGNDSTELGSYVHALLLDPTTLDQFVVLPTTGEGSRKARAAWQDANPEGIILSASQMETGKACADALKGYDLFTEFMSLEGRENEVTIVTEHPKYGFPMKARLDIFVNNDEGIYIGDVKTFGGSQYQKAMTKKALKYCIRDRGYDLQLVHYRRCVQQVLNRTPEKMYLYFVETGTPGHDRIRVDLDEGWLAHAELCLDEYYRIHNDCYQSGVYPGLNFGSPLTLTLGDNF